jgi:hypothetical protein
MRNLIIACTLLAGCTTGDSGPTGGGMTLDCATYCSTITANCTAANNQYDNMADCLGSCSHYPMGTLADMAGNTLGCRLYHANAAAGDPATHCIHAGPWGGDGVCGTACEGFCSLAEGECPTQYPAGSCAAECAGYTMTPDYSPTTTSGDTLACRMYHATAASTDPATHCVHTQMDTTGGPCAP